MKKRLNPNFLYNLLVVNIYMGNSFPKNNITHYVHHIIFNDKLGFQYEGEYITPSNVQKDFIEGVNMTFRVVDVQAKGDVIVPLHFIDQHEEKVLLKDKLRPVTGESYIAALTIAKDIMVSENKKDPDKINTDEDIDTILSWADKIDGWIQKKQEERISDF